MIDSWYFQEIGTPWLTLVYYHAGLKEIAQNTGFRGETLTLGKCGNFKRTHHFLLQSWQAIYRVMLDSFCESHSDMPDLQQVSIHATADPLLILNISEMIPIGTENVDYAKFREYVSKMATKDSTWKFWEQFVFQDCFGYIMLHLGLRCSNWTLRVAALKLMAPLFIAYDRTTYQKLIPYHLADLHKFPKSVLDCLKQGFTVSITGKRATVLQLMKPTKCASTKTWRWQLQDQPRLTSRKHHSSCGTESLLTEIYWIKSFLDQIQNR